MRFPNEEDKKKAIEKTTNRINVWQNSADHRRLGLEYRKQGIVSKRHYAGDINENDILNEITKDEQVVAMLTENLKDLTTEIKDLAKADDEILKMPEENRPVAKEALAREILGRKFRELDINDVYSHLNHDRGLLNSDNDVLNNFSMIKDEELGHALIASEKERARLNDLIEKYKNS